MPAGAAWRGFQFMAAKRSGDGQKSGLSEASPHYHGHRERLRSRFRAAGAEAVSDYELLELVLFRAIPQRDVKPLAKDLIAKFGSFAEVVAAPQALLAEVKGLGDAAITELKIVHAAASRLTVVVAAKIYVSLVPIAQLALDCLRRPLDGSWLGYRRCSHGNNGLLVR